VRQTVVCLMIAAVLLGISVLSLGVGAVRIAPGEIVTILTGNPFSEAATSQGTIIWQLRLPRILLALVVGIGLGTAGAGYQGLFRNPLADPFVIGASSGAALGATLVVILEWQRTIFGLGAVSVAALAGSLLAVAVVYAIAAVGRQVPALSLLLAGVAFSSFVGAVVSLLMFLNQEKLPTIFGWLLGSFAGRGWSTFQASAPMIAVGSGFLWLSARFLDALSLGEEAATSLGVRLARVRAFVILGASMATAASVAAGGIIGFVGLISPHLARLIVGARHSAVIPASGLIGALMMVVADDLARTVASPAELPVGVVTALMGSPFFIFLLKLRHRELGAQV
jgi:iron complex transport system permease protein